MMELTIQDYGSWLKGLSSRFKRSQIKAATSVNVEMLKFYWSLGTDIIRLEKNQPWGSGFLKKLSSDLRQMHPEAKCFSLQNLYYIRKFVSLYADIIFPQLGGILAGGTCSQVAGEILPQLGAEREHEIFHIPWGHHKYIMDRFAAEPKKALFYVRETLKNQWSRAVLINFMDTDLYARQGKAVTNFAVTLPEPGSDLAQQMTRDPYVFNHLALTTSYREKELKDALLANVERFLMELGQGFALVGREYRLMIGESENFADLLFFHVGLNCYVVVEVKVDEFKGENLGQLGLYVSAVNHLLRKSNHAPTIGLLICKTKNNIKAQWALESSNQPIGISEYRLSELVPEEIPSDLPTISEIESGLSEPDEEAK